MAADDVRGANRCVLRLSLLFFLGWLLVLYFSLVTLAIIVPHARYAMYLRSLQISDDDDVQHSRPTK